MEDKVAREDIRLLKEYCKHLEGDIEYLDKVNSQLTVQLNGLRSRVWANATDGNTLNSYPLKDISIKDCPACKHPVLALNHKGTSGTEVISVSWDYYQCLTCGSKFTCSEKCELIDEG